MRSAVCKISNVTYASYQRARTNHHPFLVLIMRDNYRGEPQTKLPPHRLQSPVFRESLHLLHSIVSLSLSEILSLCFLSRSRLFILLCSLPPEENNACWCFPRILQRKSWREDLCNPSKANRNEACSCSSVSKD